MPGRGPAGNAAVTEFLQCSVSINTAGSPPRPSTPANAALLAVMTMEPRQAEWPHVRQICDLQDHRGPSELLRRQGGRRHSSPPSWNVAPTQSVPIVAERLDEGSIERHLLVAHWGLVPSLAKDIKIGSKMINARSETILEKPSFRKAAVKRRGILPADG